MTVYFMILYLIFNFLMLLIMIFPSNLMKFHPLMLSLLLVFYSIIICLNMNYLNMNYWYSYILFLIMIGGLMILFMYFTSLASNQLFYMKMNLNIYLILKLFYCLLFLMLMILNMDWLMSLMILQNNNEIWNLYFNLNFYNKFLYMNLMMDMILYLIMYLFLTMICSVLICLKTYLPLRQLKKY